jgi:excisionase family DNA binding protein
MDRLLTTQEAADRLGVTAGRIRQMIVDGQLPAEKRGRDNFINESDLKLVEGRKAGRPRKQTDEAAKQGGKVKGKK